MPNAVVFPCPNKVDCDGSDFPLLNFSSEAKDGPLFIGLSWGSQGLGICESPVDQEAADLCARRNLCITSVAPRFFNQPQSSTVTCPDGSPFTFTTPAGLFCAGTQGDADAQAIGYAADQAQKRVFCVNCPFVGQTLKTGDPFNGQFTFTGAATSVQFTLLTGSLPPGLTMDIAGHVTGTVTGTISGDYPFMVKAVDQNGDFMIKACSFKVTGTQPVCPDPGCGPGLCFNQGACACIGYGNDAQSGTLACPCNPLITVSGTIPKCTYQSANAADYPDALNRQAQNQLTNLLWNALAPLCGSVTFSNALITNNTGCSVTFDVFNSHGGFADPSFHSVTVSAHSALDWCALILGLTGGVPCGALQFSGPGTSWWFNCGC